MSSGGVLRSILIIGSSQLANIIISILRVKLIAVMLGPAGVGLMGIFQNLTDLVTTGAGLGLASSGVRSIARSHGDPVQLKRIQQVLLWALILQGALAALVIWLLRSILTENLFGGSIEPDTLGFVALSVWIGLIASAMTTVIEGLRRISDLAKIVLLGSSFGTTLGLVVIFLLGFVGLPIMILGLALGKLFAAMWFLRRTPVPCVSTTVLLHERLRIWSDMVKLGSAFMIGGLLSNGTLFVVRNLIQQRLGLEAVGQFEASWALAITYIGFILQAMSADYYPRLSEVIDDRIAVNKMVNQQIQIGLVLGGPLILIMLGLAPVAVNLLYSSDFHQASDLLQWQTLGNVFKLSAWAMGFVVLAKGRGVLFILLEIVFSIWFGGVILWLIDAHGVMAAGPAFVIAYGIYFFATLVAARQLTGFRWERTSLKIQLIYGLVAAVLFIMVRGWPIIGAVVSVLCAIGGVFVGFKFLLMQLDPIHPMRMRIAKLPNWMQFGVTR